MKFDSDFRNRYIPKSLDINYMIVGPQTNNKLCKYVCHTRSYSDMGHLLFDIVWENGVKPDNSKKYEENIEKIVYNHFDEYGIGYTTNNGAYLFKGRHPNRERNIMRFYLDGDIFVRADYN